MKKTESSAAEGRGMVRRCWVGRWVREKPRKARGYIFDNGNPHSFFIFTDGMIRPLLYHAREQITQLG